MPIGSLVTPDLFYIAIIKLRSVILIFINFIINRLVRRLTIIYHIFRWLTYPIQRVLNIITGNHISLVNFMDDDFVVGISGPTLLEQWNNGHNYNDVDMKDVFHAYLSKLMYESDESITDHCQTWGFDGPSIRIFFTNRTDLQTYTYSTKAVVLKHDDSHRIIVAFRGTEPMDLIQWITDASTDFIEVNHRFNYVRQPIKVHAGFYHALGLNLVDLSQPIDLAQANNESSIFIQILNFIRECHSIHPTWQISITGHSLGAALAYLFTFALLNSDYKESISAVYTYGQPLVGNIQLAQTMTRELNNRIHRWVNNNDIVSRVPVIALPSIAWYYFQTTYSDGLQRATSHGRYLINAMDESRYYHSGLRRKINLDGLLQVDETIDPMVIRASQDRLVLFRVTYSLREAKNALLRVTPFRFLLWIIAPPEINDHFPGDYARKIKAIVRANNNHRNN